MSQRNGSQLLQILLNHGGCVLLTDSLKGCRATNNSLGHSQQGMLIRRLKTDDMTNIDSTKQEIRRILCAKPTLVPLSRLFIIRWPIIELRFLVATSLNRRKHPSIDVCENPGFDWGGRVFFFIFYPEDDIMLHRTAKECLTGGLRLVLLRSQTLMCHRQLRNTKNLDTTTGIHTAARMHCITLKVRIWTLDWHCANLTAVKLQVR